MEQTLFDVDEPTPAPTPTRLDPARFDVYRDALRSIPDAAIGTGDAPFIHVVRDTRPVDWTPNVITAVWRLVTGTYRTVLEDSGWDVDLLPAPPTPSRVPAAGYRSRPTQARTPQTRAADETAAARAAAGPTPAPTPPQAQPAPTDGASVVDLRGDRVHITTPTGHPLRENLRTIPGASWDGITAWTLPVTHRSAVALRAALTGHRVQIGPDAATALKAAADTPADPHGTVTDDRIEIRAEHSPALADDLKRHIRARWDGPAGCWWTDPTADHAEALLKIATTHTLVLDQAITDLAATRSAPFDYDLTIDGLRGVPVTELHTVQAAPARGKTKSLADRFADLGIESVYDLLMVIPRRYLDRSTAVPVADLSGRIGDEVGLLATVRKVGAYDRVKRIVRIEITDETGVLSITFFHSPWMASRFRTGDRVSVYGKVDQFIDRSGTRHIQMTNPVMDPLGAETTTMVPIYPQSEKSRVTTWDLHTSAMEAVRRLGALQDPLADDLRAEHDLVTRLDAFTHVHNAPSATAAANARTRLAFDELLRLQLTLGLRRHAAADETGVQHQPSGDLSNALIGSLPFPLTGAQQRAIDEIRTDLVRPHPMNRLLQGDVGAGKSLVAMATLLAAVEGGHQAALMAPTEILAAQLHYEATDRLADITHAGRPLAIEFLASKTRAADKRRILAGLADGTVDIVVGTHSLISDDVEFANLGLVVIDEQHRFGVEQRARLRSKGTHGVPDVLAMTATPIPRTAALTTFGDLAISVLDELPPGRTPIATTWLDEEPPLDAMTGAPWDTIRAEVDAGHQAYVVASLVEDNEKVAAASAEAALEALSGGALHGLRLGLVHGRQARDDREQTMDQFKAGDIDVLIATTVIEVGVNVPRATVMVILDAPRFGIAQLHQIRGRVGRGQHASQCVLTGAASSADATQRMEALVASTDGFYLSEVDLNLRGSGSLLGSRQSGETDLRVASLRDDLPLIETCRTLATTMLDGDPRLNRRPGLRQEVASALGPDAAEWLTRA